MKEVEECMGNFSTKCLSPLQREVIGLLSGSDDETRQMCVQGSEVRARKYKYNTFTSKLYFKPKYIFQMQ